MYRTVIYARSGRRDEALTEAGKLIEAYPNFGNEMRSEFEKWHFPEDAIDSYTETLRDIGVNIPDPTN
jgi:hypothetical protein